MVSMATAAHYKPFLVSVLLLIWTPWPQLVADAQSTTALTPDNLSAKEGETVTLVCTYQPETDEIYFGSLSWQMGDTVLASVSCPSACSRTYANTNRYTLDVDYKSSGNLTITGVSLEDNNVYQCRVSTLNGNAESDSRLLVNVPPVSLKLSDTVTPGGHEQGGIVPILSGESYNLTCTTQPGANPPADLEWTSTSAQIIQRDKYDQLVTGSKLTVSSREVMFTPSVADHLTTLTCKAKHPAVVTPLTKFVQLDVQVSPSNVNIAYNSAIVPDGGSLTLQEGIPSTITCESLGTRPASAITWYLDGVQVSSGVDRPEPSPNVNDRRLQDASSSIIIQFTREHHEKVLRCQAIVFGVSRDTSIRITVDVPPVSLKLSDTITPGGYEQGDIVPVLLGKSYTLTCTTQPGANPPVDLEWTSTTAQITQGDKVDQQVTGGKLTVSTKEVTFTPSMADHLTTVTCEATHPALSTSLTKLIQLDVQGFPTSNDEFIAGVPWGLYLPIGVSVVVVVVLIAIIVHLKRKNKQSSITETTRYFNNLALTKTPSPTQAVNSGDHMYQDLNASPRLVEQGCDQAEDQADFILHHSYEDFPATEEREETQVTYSKRILKG